MISIKKTYTLYKDVLDDILYTTMAHKLTTYGFFYYPKLLSDKTDVMVFECAVTDDIRKKALVEKCIQLLADWDGVLQYKYYNRRCDKVLQKQIDYFNTCPLSHITVTSINKDNKKTVLLSRPINITIDLLDISVPNSAPSINFVLKRR